MAKEEYPFCTHCDEKIGSVRFDKDNQNIIYLCGCGQVIVVKINND
jgi:hypothetical protein